MFVLSSVLKKQRPTIEAAARFFEGELFSPQMKKTCYTLIHLSSAMCRVPGMHGFTDVLDYDDNDNPRSFIIELRKFKYLKKTLIALAHEMVHVKQFAYDEINDRCTRWKSKKVDRNKIMYNQLPWEKEAYKMETLLYEKFMASQKCRTPK